FVTRHGIDTANRYVQSGLERLSGVGNKQLVMFSIGAFIYAALLFTEGIGLWLQKRWAEYLTAFATALFIPFELYELYERFTWVRIAILALNIFVVWYLATRLKDEKVENFVGKGIPYHGARVKICGITNLADAQHAVECGTDELGFNFYEKSPRYISPEDAREIIEKLTADVIKVGVFVNESQERILEIVSIAKLDAIQLHGDEDYGYVIDLIVNSDLMIIKAVRPRSYADVKDAVAYDAHAILVDSFSNNEYGGSGIKANWERAIEIWTMVPCVYLAGGLTPENVAMAIHTVRPYAVDVASGVESSPGKKDPEKVAAFIKVVKKAL
ncbi:MAG: phosphoribosylanthranilate isomerase, partial [Pyrinomonadaceae bacterium]